MLAHSIYLCALLADKLRWSDLLLTHLPATNQEIDKMDFDVYFQVGDKLCGPFDSSAANQAEMIAQAVLLGKEWHLPRDAVVVVSPKKESAGLMRRIPIWAGLLFGSAAAATSLSIMISVRADAFADGACLLCSMLSAY
jgi:hypothetical protein